MFSIVLALGYSLNNNLYNSVKDLFSILSNVYAILIGFNISAVVFIVSFLFKESLNKVMYDKNKLNQLYKQIVNSFMLSTFNNLGVIVLGLYHLIIVKTFSIFISAMNFPDSIIYILDIFYLSIWIFLILSSLIVFFKCLTILTRLLRVAHSYID